MSAVTLPHDAVIFCCAPAISRGIVVLNDIAKKEARFRKEYRANAETAGSEVVIMIVDVTVRNAICAAVIYIIICSAVNGNVFIAES